MPKITALPIANSAATGDLLVLDQGNVTKQLDFNTLQSAVANAGTVQQLISAAVDDAKITTHHQFFGPIADTAGALQQVFGASYSFPGAALSASTKNFYFNHGLRVAIEVNWFVIWATFSTDIKVELVYMDSGPSNITQITEITGTGSGTPVAAGVDITAAFNALISAGIYKTLGNRYKGNGIDNAVLYESRLEITW